MRRTTVHLLTLLGALTLLAPTLAHARGSYITAFETRYPNSTLSMDLSCALCHPNNNTTQFNAYGNAFRLASGTTDQRYAAVESKDSDGDGFTNLQEINANTDPSSASSRPAAPTPTPTPTPKPTPTPTPKPTATPTPIPTATPTPTPKPTVTPTPTPIPTVTPTPTPKPTVTPIPTVTPTPTPKPTATPTPTPRPTVTPTPTPAPVQTTEIKLMKLLVDQHYAALQFSTVAEGKATRLELKMFARHFSVRTKVEMEMMLDRLVQWAGLVYTPQTAAGFDQLLVAFSAKSGQTFDTAFLNYLISFDTQHLNLLRQYQWSLQHAEMKSMAQYMISTDTGELVTLRTWLSQFAAPTPAPTPRPAYSDDGERDDD